MFKTLANSLYRLTAPSLFSQACAVVTEKVTTHAVFISVLAFQRINNHSEVPVLLLAG